MWLDWKKNYWTKGGKMKMTFGRCQSQAVVIVYDTQVNPSLYSNELSPQTCVDRGFLTRYALTKSGGGINIEMASQLWKLVKKNTIPTLIGNEFWNWEHWGNVHNLARGSGWKKPLQSWFTYCSVPGPNVNAVQKLAFDYCIAVLKTWALANLFS